MCVPWRWKKKPPTEPGAKLIEEAARQEQLRANLLRSISHDLRTPLTSISGNALILTEKNPLLTEEKRRELSAAIYEDANWLNHLVENLLSITRMENGQVNLRIQPELIQDIFDDVLAHLDHDAARHTIVTNVADDLLMADMDAQLIEQVLVNLINNAIKYTPEHSRIELFAAPEGKLIVFLNGVNNDDISKKIYADWKERHKNDGKISGSRQADMKSAVVEEFRNHACILIGTEAASEGINLQFCSLLVNYDLPWNPQRIEQRIGRCHRYGQKNDVVVIN